MNDLYFIKYKPNLMMLDTLGMSKEGKVAHRQLFDMTIIQDGPPLNDDTTLRELASCDPKDWGRVKGELIGKGWKVKGDYFLHKGTIETLNESKAEYVASYNRTAPANKKPKLELTKPDSVTGCVTFIVTSDVTPNVTPNVTTPMTPTHLQLQSQLLPKLTTKGGDKALESEKGKKKLTPSQWLLAQDFEKTFGDQWINDAGKWVNRVKANYSKCERVLAEVKSAIKEKRIKKTVAQYAEQIWKEFK
jgi:hypothetical protein